MRVEPINQLELRMVYLALKFPLPFLRHCHVLVCSDNVVMFKYSNQHGGTRSDGTLQISLGHLPLVSIMGTNSPARMHCQDREYAMESGVSTQKLRPRSGKKVGQDKHELLC